MLQVSVSKDRRFGRLGRLGGKNGIKTPGLAERVITLSVSLPATPKLLTRSGSKLKALGQIILVGVLSYMASFPLHLYKVDSDQPPAITRPTACQSQVCIGLSPGASASAETKERRFWARVQSAGTTTYLEAGMTSAILFIWFALWWGHKKLITVHVALLRPYEAFPIVPHEIQLAPHEYFYAVRLLGKGSEERYSKPLLENNEIDPLFSKFFSSDLVADQPHDLLRLRQWPIRDYSALIRHALTDLLPNGSGPSSRETIKALYFTYKQHTWTLWWYMTLIVIAILVPALNWKITSPDSQFPLLMGGLGIAWAALATMLHRSKARHLDQWDFRALGYPFSGCPVFQYTKVQSIRESWDLVNEVDFHRRITSFGVDHNTLQQWVLAGLLVIYLAILQLIK